MTLQEEKILKNTIKQMVRESIFDFINGGMYEKKSEDSDKKEKSDNKEEESKISSKRKRRIIHALKDKTVDVAQYAYRLWPDKDEDSARSYFYKCLDGKTNDSGDIYSFTDDEYVQLESFLTDVVPEV